MNNLISTFLQLWYWLSIKWITTIISDMESISRTS